MGTVAYMSPEQARGKPVDARSDIWSLGAVLYEIVAGRVPFEGETSTDVLAAILKTNPEPLPEKTPPELRRIIGKTLRHDKEERYQTTGELLVDLRNLKQDLEFDEKLERQINTSSGGQKFVSSAATDQIHPVSGIKPRRLPLILATAAVLIIGISVASYYFLQNKNQPKQLLETVKIDSLAVLPFENDSPNTEYLSNGLTESLINSLSNLPGLRVVSRNTVFGFKNKTPQEAGQVLNVRTVLTGKVSQNGESVTIQSELVDLVTNSQLWGERYTVKINDILQIQEQIARQITDKLQLKLNNQQKAGLAKHYTENAEAYREYLKGRFYTLQYSFEGHKKALEHLNKAIEIDPTYALAYAGVADAYTTASDTFLSPREGLSKAKSAANKALELDDQLAEAWAARGHARLHEWDKSAIDDLNRAVAMAPNSLTTQLWLGEYYMIWDVPKSVQIVEKAAELDPLSAIPNSFLSFDYYMLRQPARSIEYSKKSADLSPNFFPQYAYMARVYADMGDLKSAENELNKIPPQAAGAIVLSTKAYLFARQGKRREAEEIAAELQKLSTTRYVPPFEIATVYAVLDDRDQTFLWLNKAFEDRSENLGFIRNIPFFDSVRPDPRYAELMRKIGFTQ